jgi:hypothetical protein
VDNCGRRKDEQWTAVADGKTSSGKLWQMIIRAVDSCDLNANHSRDRVLPFFALGAARPPRRSGGRDHFACALSLSATKIVQGWPKLWANFKALIGIFSQRVGPSLAIWANHVQFSFAGRGSAQALPPPRGAPARGSKYINPIRGPAHKLEDQLCCRSVCCIPYDRVP